MYTYPCAHFADMWSRNFCNWYLQSVHGGRLDPKLTSLFIKTLDFIWVDMWTHKLTHTEVQKIIRILVPLHDVQLCLVWPVCKDYGPCLSVDLFNSEWYIRQLLQVDQKPSLYKWFSATVTASKNIRDNPHSEHTTEGLCVSTAM